MATLEDAQAERGKTRLTSLFQPYRNDKKCHRCGVSVYQYEKIGPINEAVFHTTCFRCAECGQFLTMKTCCTNQIDADDQEVYCFTHHPRIGAVRLDNKSMAIKSAVDVQNDFTKPHLRASEQSRPHMDAQAMGIKQALNAPKAGKMVNEQILSHDRAQIDASALHIQGALHAQALQKRYQKNFDKHHYPAHIVKKKQQIFDAQKKLEEQLRKEEDELLRTFKAQRKEEAQKLTEEIDHEWETKLKDLTDKFDREFEKKKKRDTDKKAMTMQFEHQKKDLENTMTLKREKKKQTMTLKLREKEQNMTSSMVKKQSEQMLGLIVQMNQELKEELKREYEKEQDKAKAKGTNSKAPLVNGGGPAHGDDADGSGNSSPIGDINIDEALGSLISPAAASPPAPAPPKFRKKQLYSDVSVFEDIDEMVIKVAQNDQLTYTDLVRQLTETLVSDLEKARAIYRWITVKDLNVMEFDDVVDADTPMGLLRGIKYGTETYHTLFMRLCSYAGLPCIEIKGHSKSVGYEPGMKIQPESFQNTWNAVLLDTDWRLVQCNWGARHLVLNKDKDSDKKKRDQIRYQYDEHYFLADPDEFIQEFWPYEPEWQLLEKAITLDEFEKLPFVRSIFFHYCMRFEGGKKAVLETNEKGGVDITIRIPEELEESLVFYYQLRFAEKEKRNETSYKGASLERFVYQTMVENCVMFSVHVPVMGEYFFEIFANKINDANKIGLDPNSAMTPFRLKCACKFKVCCKQLTGKMHPLPNCASGEWGPKKAQRHFNIAPHYDKPANGEKQDNFNAGIVNADDDFELKFTIPRPLQFVAKLRMNQVDDHILDPFVNLSMQKDVLTVYVSIPQPGQYGLDLYARPKESADTHTLSHACKYLVNCGKVTSPVEIPKSTGPSPAMNKDRWGPTTLFDKYGLKTISHKEAKIKVNETNHVAVEIGVPERVHLTYQFIREPDEDDREYVSMVKENDGKIAKFLVNMPKSGNYMLALYARRDSDEAKTMMNVFNYLIQYNTGNQVNGGVNTNGHASNGHGKETKESKSFFKKLTKK